MSRVKVFVGGASQEKERVRAFMDRVRRSDLLELALDWTADLESAGATPAERQARDAYAAADLQAIQESEVFVALAPYPPATTKGLWFEMCYATFAGIQVLASGPVDDFLYTGFSTDARVDLDACRESGRDPDDALFSLLEDAAASYRSALEAPGLFGGTNGGEA